MPDASAAVEKLLAYGYAPDSYSVDPADKVRRFIAARMTDTVRTVPQFSLESDIAVDRLLGLRADWNADKPAARLSVNDLIVRASALALVEVPEVNVSYVDDWVIHHRDADIAVVVAIPGGLMTPIVRAAQTKSAAAIATEIRDMAARAQQRRLRPEEYAGGSFSISNLGMYGVRRFNSIINPPQAAILSVGAVRPDSFGQSVSVTMTCDHRALDGVAGARWLQCFRGLLEAPEGLVAEPA